MSENDRYHHELYMRRNEDNARYAAERALERRQRAEDDGPSEPMSWAMSAAFLFIGALFADHFWVGVLPSNALPYGIVGVIGIAVIRAAWALRWVLVAGALAYGAYAYFAPAKAVVQVPATVTNTSKAAVAKKPVKPVKSTSR